MLRSHGSRLRVTLALAAVFFGRVGGRLISQLAMFEICWI